MNATLEKSFELFVRRISLSQREIGDALNRAEEICQFLSQATAIHECQVTGSMAHSTAIQGFSDVDILVALSPDPSTQSTPHSITAKLLETLKPRYREAYISENTVHINFTQGPDVDVIPAIPDTASTNGEITYRIPSPDRIQWNTYTPARRNQEINQKSALLGSDFVHLIKVIKWWSKHHGQPIASYEIENFASATYSRRMPPLTRAIVDFFEFAKTSSTQHREDCFTKISEARAIANKALRREQQGDIRGAIDHWGSLLGDQFPSVVS
ncbi:nucleotidyltransferase domain-containing protein [Streptomyces sp. NPDC006140]|uniref:SMODS domain-containing nucleotidyltransferase n=1 Tax=Streptomyces sp. NPDC006140 TaxID=3154579 RepID=UPI0033E4F73E